MSFDHFDNKHRIRGGRARFARPIEWRTKYGSPPVGDPLKATAMFREEWCWSCGGHARHAPGQCKQRALVTTKPCECPGR